MATTYTWKVDNMDIIPSKDGYEGVIYRVVWKCTAKTDSGEEKSQIGVIDLNVANIGPSFKPIEEVTESDVIGWVKQSVAVTAIEAGLVPEVRSAIFDETGKIVSPTVPEAPSAEAPTPDTKPATE